MKRNSDIDDFNLFEDEDNEPCPVFDAVCSIMALPKPFGFLWENDEKLIKFLEKRGYRVLQRQIKNKEGKKENISIAVKPDSTNIPDLDYSNIREVFQEECQDIILNWLLKIAE